MRRLFSFIAVLSVVFGAMSTEPDFAYPQTVIKNAEASLSTALDDDDVTAKIQALLYITKAKSSIDPDSLKAMPQRISAIASGENDIAAKAIILLLGTQVRDQLYDAGIYGAKNDLAVIQALADSALTLALSVPEERISRFDKVVSIDAVSRKYFPTVADFVAAKSASLHSLPQSSRKEINERMIDASREGSWPWSYWKNQEIASNGTGLSDWLQAYDDYSAYECARIFLVSACESAYVDAQRETLLPLIEASLDEFPSYWDNERLRSYRDMFLQPVVNASFTSIIAPGLDLTVNLSYKYASNIGAQLYKVTTDNFNMSHNAKNWEKKERKTIEADGTVAKGDTVVSFTIKEPGIYAVLPVLNDSVSTSGWYNDFVYCTPFVPIALNGCTEQAVVTADWLTGAPFPGVNVICEDGKNLGVTGVTGSLNFKLPGTQHPNYYPLRFKYEGTTYNFLNNIATSAPWIDNGSTSYEAKVFISRPLYHPGDSLEWCVAIAKKTGTKARVLASDTKLSVSLINANGQKIAEQEITTDNMGRGDGSFVIPTDGLTGNYCLTINRLDGNQWVAQQSVTVSDFKMPEFEVTVSSVERTADAVIFKANAQTYAGMPVADGNVSVSVNGAYRWRWFRPTPQEVFNCTASTDSLGLFKIEIPQSALKETEYDCFIAAIRVADQAGNAAETSTPFTIGKPYMLSAEIASDHRLDASKKNTITINAFTPSGESVKIASRWEFVDKDGKAVATGEALTCETVEMRLKDIEAGRYTIRVSASDTDLADEVAIWDVTIYNTKKGTMPTDEPFFLPSLSATADNGRAVICVGVPTDDTYLYTALCSGKELLNLDVMKRNRGFADITINLPERTMSAELKIFAVSQGKATVSEVHISVPDRRILKLEGESFRDHITPGATEHWRLRLSSEAAETEFGALVATMYNHALESIKAMRWPSDFSSMRQWNRLITSLIYAGDNTLSISKRLSNRKLDNLSLPLFNPELNLYSAYVGNNILSSAYGASTRIIKVRGTTAKTAAAYDLAENIAETESLAEESEDGGQSNLQNPDLFDYRDAEVLQAFWMPSLNIAEDGSAEIEFDVPQANTTWTFRAFAWTDDIRSAQMMRQVLANKPVMVEANLPRFLRAGDSADVTATVYNNSDTTDVIATTVDVFDTHGKVLSTNKFINSLSSKESATVTVRINASDSQAAIGYRVRSEGATFSDGEQAFIPVLPTLTTVVESELFYLNPGDETFTMELPAMQEGHMTLQYCQNPTWNVIKALPALYTKTPKTAIEANNMLFGALTAKGLRARHPEITKVIDEWNANPADSALVSRLTTNESLKIALLESTPWVQAAENATERMARLQTLFDTKAIEMTAEKAIATLAKLQNADGGFRWGDWSDRSSTWVTTRVLEQMGYLNAIGFLPKDGNTVAMTAKALEYIDFIACSDSASPTRVPVAYLYSLFPYIEPSATAKTHIASQVQSIIKNWKEAPTVEKARYALILNANSYHEIAKEIMGSIKEFAVSSATQGTSFPSIANVDDYTLLMRAFSDIADEAVILDGMRQWLILREQANDGFASGNPAALIAGLLTRGSYWNETASKNCPVTINGHAIATDRVEAATGYIVASLPTFGSGTELAVTPSTATPSYGSVMTVRTAQSLDVKPSSCEAMSISKRIMVKHDGEWVESADLNRGDEAQIVLTLDVTRDLQYVTIVDERPAPFEPADQLPGWIYAEHIGFYRENRDSETNISIEYLPRGRYQLAIDMSVSMSGMFTSGIATAQSQLAPEITAHSGGSSLSVK